MSDDIPASLAEAMAEIRRLRGEAATMRHASGEARLNTYVPPDYVAVEKARFDDMAAEIERLRAELREATQLVLKLEKARFIRNVVTACELGTLEQPPAEDEPTTYTHNVPPSAPPHNE